MHRRLLAIAVCVTAAATVAAPAAGAALPRVLTQDGRHPFSVRPATIGYTGDGTGVVGGVDGTSARHPGHLRWTSYTQRGGLASGIVWLDDCEPSCAEGTFTGVPVSVHVFAAVRWRFTRLTLKFTYQGRATTDRRAIQHFGTGKSAFWAYSIVR